MASQQCEPNINIGQGASVSADDDGLVRLGPLDSGIANVSVRMGRNAERKWEWELPFAAEPAPPGALHIVADSAEPVRVRPVTFRNCGHQAETRPDQFSLALCGAQYEGSGDRPMAKLQMLCVGFLLA